MKIVHICPTYTKNLSYQENYLTKYQKKMGYDITVITSQWIYNDTGKLVLTDETSSKDENGIKIVRLRYSNCNNYNYKFKKFNNLISQLVTEKPDVIFLHGCQWVYVNDVVNFLKTNKNVILYVDNHADYSNSATNWFSKNILHKIIWRHYARKLIPYTEKFYGVLPERVEILKKLYKIPSDKCQLLLMGADDELVTKYNNNQVREKIKHELNITNNDFIIVTGGKIDNSKIQTLYLMKAVNKLKNVKLIIFGSVIQELKEQFDSLLGNNIIYVGWIKSNETYRYISIADLVVFPGRHSVLWEQTVAQGKPLIVKYWNGTTHVDIGGNVKFLYNDSENEILNIITEIVNNKNMTFTKMKKFALLPEKSKFLYSKIAIESVNYHEK